MDKHQIRKLRILRHRKEQYEKAIQMVIDGKVSPEYATERWKKLKAVQ